MFDPFTLPFIHNVQDLLLICKTLYFDDIIASIFRGALWHRMFGSGKKGYSMIVYEWGGVYGDGIVHYNIIKISFWLPPFTLPFIHNVQDFMIMRKTLYFDDIPCIHLGMYRCIVALCNQVFW